MTTFAQLIDRLRPTLNDARKTRHPDAKLFGYAVDGLRETVVLRPDLYTTNTTVPAAAGVEQVLPAGGLVVVDVFGTEGGSGISYCDFDALNLYRPDWRKDPVGPAQHWLRLPSMPGKRINNHFFLWPPQAGGEPIQGSFVIFNPDGLTINDAIPLQIDYEPALEAYVVFRAESEDDQHAVTQRAAQFRGAFESLLGVGAQTEAVAEA